MKSDNVVTVRAVAAVLLPLWLGLGACATPQVEVLSQTELYPPAAQAQVEVTLERPKRPHRVFAWLEDRNGGTPEEINDRLARKGAEIGADAVVITRVNDQSVTEWIYTDPCFREKGAVVCWPHYRPVRFTFRSVRASAIKYTGPP
jgi:hypothetical protein